MKTEQAQSTQAKGNVFWPASREASLKIPSYPKLEEQPQYIAEVEKLQTYHAELSAAQKKLDELNARFARGFVGGDAEHDVEMADRLIEVGGATENLRDQAANQVRLIDALRIAIPAQRHRIQLITSELTRQARLHFAREHKEYVQRIVECVEALGQANREQQKYVEAVRDLGYDNSIVTDMTCERVGRDIADPNGDDNAFYWLKDAKEYIAEPDDLKPDEREAQSKRKGRLTALLG